MSDPFEILDQHILKIGGWDNLKSLESVYIEASLDLKGTGLSGTYKEWKKFSPETFRNKIDYDVGVLKEIVGYNVTSIWKEDNHGKVTNITTKELQSEFQLKGLLEKYEFANSNSKYFKISMQNENGYYIFTLQNYLNEHLIKYHLNKSTLLLDKKTEIKKDYTEITSFNDYRLIKRLMVPFEITIEIPEMEQIQHIKISTYNYDQFSESIFYPPKEDAKDFEFLEDATAENIPFDFFAGHIYLNVFINEKKGNFILDSGAAKSFLDNQFCKSLGLKKTGNIKAQGAGSESADISIVICKTIIIDNIKLNNQTLLTVDLVDRFYRVTGIQLDGLLGFDFLSRFITKIDFAKQLISFYDPKEFKYTGKGSIVKAELVDNMFRIPLTIDNKYKGYWRVDTGAKGLSFHYSFAKENNLDEKDGLLAIAEGIGGEFKSKTVRFNEIEIGEFKINKPLISFPIEEMKGAFASKSIIGTLGTDVLRHFNIFFDYKDNRLILEQGESFNINFPEDQSGIQLEKNDKGDIFTKFISPDSPAEKAGLLQNDIIVKINNKPVSEFKNLIDLGDCFGQLPNTNITLEVIRDKHTHEIKLKLEKLI